MKSEYLIFNILIVLGPLILSFDRKVHYVSQWGKVITAIILVLIPFVVWDSLVTGIHWWFNSAYTLDIKIAQLPVEEWLFFMSVPFAVLFIWEIIEKRIGNPVSEKLKIIPKCLTLAFLPGFLFIWLGKVYTGLTLVSLGIAGLLEIILKVEVLSRKKSYPFFAIVIFLILIFNGYLTTRPVVLYNPAYQLDFRVITIPIEDFGYGFVLILLNIIIFEKLKEKEDG
jgi:lycopene cyclase domain-containing protein